MKTSTLHIDNPSSRLLNNLRKLREEKEMRKEQMRAEWAKYFPKK